MAPKRAKPRPAELDPAEAARLQQKLDQGQALDSAEVLKVLQPAGSSCDKQHGKPCKGRKDAPNCLCGLVPASGSFRRKGLWRKDTDALLSLGPDPNDARREDLATPSGLNNLGNTCYVNAALQCLFMIARFRRGIFALEPPLDEDSHISPLRLLYAHLQAGPRSSADPTEFAKCLHLDHTVQQDGQEFLKLLLNLLETRLAQSQQSEVRKLVPTLFRGSYVYLTTCQVCGRPSASSHRSTDFYELDIKVKDFSSLEESLTSALSEEVLEGDNQYLCDACNGKRNATRQLVLQSLPPYLCFSLQRFVFDMKTFNKVKVTSKFEFPMALALGAFVRLEAVGEEGCRYELMGILIHKGSSASHGHYVAHVKDETTSKWWRFDDEAVSEMKAGPIGENADHGVASNSNAAKKAKPKTGSKRAKTASVEETDEGLCTIVEAVRPSEASIPSTAVPAASQSITSANAYMLLYRRTSQGHQSTTNSTTDVVLPPRLQEVIKREQEQFDEVCAKYQQTREEMTQQVKDRQASVRSILEAAACGEDSEDECRWVSAAWLQQWADSPQEPGPIDNAVLLCPHGKLDPGKITEMKRISVQAWHQLQETHRGGPEVSSSDVCQQCLAARISAVASASEQGEARDAVMAAILALEQEAASYGAAGAYYISKVWLTGWKRSRKMSSAASPTQGITCPHGQLAPEAASAKAKRAAVPHDVWAYFKACWEQAATQQPRQPAAHNGQLASTREHDIVECIDMDHEAAPMPASCADANGHAYQPNSTSSPEEDTGPEAQQLHEFRVGDAVECNQCLRDLAAGAELHQEQRGRVEEERSVLATLASGTAVYLTPGTTYNLAPRQWLQDWRHHLASLSKRSATMAAKAESAAPEALGVAMQRLLCSCHPPPRQALAARPPALANKRGKWVQANVQENIWEVVEAHDWQSLLAYHGDDRIRAVTAVPLVHSQPVLMSALEGVEEDEVVIGEDLSMLQAPHIAIALGEAVLETDPQVCEATIMQHEAAAKGAALTYTDAELMVEVVKEDEIAQSAAVAPATERKSKRARRGRAPVKASSTASIRELKLLILQAVEVHPQNARLYVRGKLVENDDLTLAECEIYPDEELRVVNAGMVDDGDLAGLFDATSATGGRRTIERGFTGTALAGGGGGAASSAIEVRPTPVDPVTSTVSERQ